MAKNTNIRKIVERTFKDRYGHDAMQRLSKAQKELLNRDDKKRVQLFKKGAQWQASHIATFSENAEWFKWHIGSKNLLDDYVYLINAALQDFDCQTYDEAIDFWQLDRSYFSKLVDNYKSFNKDLPRMKKSADNILKPFSRNFGSFFGIFNPINMPGGLNTRRTRHQLAFDSLTPDQLRSFFLVVHESGAHETIKSLFSEDESVFPFKVRNKYIKWEKKHIYDTNRDKKKRLKELKKLVDDVRQEYQAYKDEHTPVKPEPEVAILEPAPVDHIQIIDAINLVEKDYSDEGLPATHSEIEGLTNGRENKNRTNKLIDILKQNKIGATVYRDVSDNEKHPYNVVVINTPEIQAQILVNDFYGFTTMVHKKPLAYDPNKKVLTSDFKESEFVWTVPHIEDTQWESKVVELLNADVETLEPELKSKTFWADKYNAVVDTLISTVLNTGALFKTSDKTIVEHGRLAGRTTPARIYGALKRGTIAKLNGTRSFHKLFNQLCEENPHLSSFLHEAPVNATELFNEAVTVSNLIGVVPQQMFSNDFTLCKHSCDELSFAFQKQAVQGWDELCEKLDLIIKPEYPQSFDEFIISSKIGYRSKGGGLMPTGYYDPK